MTDDSLSLTILSRRPLSFGARDLLAIGFRRRGLIALTFAAIFIIVSVVAFSRPTVYEATMKILVKRERAEEIVSADQAATYQANTGVTEQEINSEIELLWSRDLHEKVVVANRLHERANRSLWARLKGLVEAGPSEDAGDSARISAAVLAFQDWFQVQPYKKSNLIRVSYSSPDPRLAVQVINTVMELYLAKHLAVHRPAGAFGFFEQETERYRKELELRQARVAEYGRSEGVIDVQAEKEATLRQLSELDTGLYRTQVEIAEAEGRIRALEAQAARTPERTTTEIREASSDLLEQQRTSLLGLELKRIELLQVFQPTYPPVQEVERQIQLIRSAIAAAEAKPLVERTTARDVTHEWLTTELAKIRSGLPGLRARAAATARSIEQYEARSRHLDRVQTTHENLARDAKLAEQNYLTYARKREEARISDELDSRRIVNVAIAESPTVPYVPAGPGKKVILMLALVLAGVGSIVLSFAVDYCDPTFRTPDEVRAFLAVPVLAALPSATRRHPELPAAPTRAALPA